MRRARRSDSPPLNHESRNAVPIGWLHARSGDGLGVSEHFRALQKIRQANRRPHHRHSLNQPPSVPDSAVRWWVRCSACHRHVIAQAKVVRDPERWLERLTCIACVGKNRPHFAALIAKPADWQPKSWAPHPAEAEQKPWLVRYSAWELGASMSAERARLVRRKAFRERRKLYRQLNRQHGERVPYKHGR